MPCLDPVMMMEEGLVWDVMEGSSVLMPFMMPKRLTERILLKYEEEEGVAKEPRAENPALRKRMWRVPGKG